MSMSETQWETFKESAPWKEIKETLEDWIEGIKTDVFKADTIEQVRIFQGSVEALEYFLALPDTLIQAIKVEKEIEDGP